MEVEKDVSQNCSAMQQGAGLQFYHILNAIVFKLQLIYPTEITLK